ncbi:hypothetical protein EC957_008510 [Mortierella hygrophila]|uniref:C2H2-type domain-containing protein n=1 Tax=Mortierella hygrophila TaxID=979708 RepID=A0A9P6JY31_9FUNG|nr:hypothetical protein EC957_008510 [Mortierella hygrophila]
MQQVDEYEEDYDYVFLSDFENDASSSPEVRDGSGAKGKSRVSIGSSHTIHSPQKQPQGSETSFQHRQRTPESQRSESESDQDDDFDNNNDDSLTVKSLGLRSEEQVGNRDELDGSDGEEIEYGYETDLLVIMPAMLRNYSHHATNYHPELWRPAPGPGSGRNSTQASSVRCRQEDRILDREELLKNTIPSTTCGICFESFMTFDLDPLQEQQQEHQEDSTATSSRVQFARTFTERLARSFSLQSVEYSQQPRQQMPGCHNAASTSTSEQGPTSRRISTVAPSITPSMSSKELGLILPCDHGLCLSCLQSFLLNATQNPQARFPTVCPQPGCRTPIPTESAEWVLDKETLEIWYRKLAEIHVANKVCCPLPECRSIVDLDDRDGTAVTCPECRNSFCASCAVPFHRENRHKAGKQKKTEQCSN